MFSFKSIGRPRTRSFVLAAIFAAVAFSIQKVSSFGGYWLALLTMVMIVVAEITGSIWPSRNKPENVFVFSLFWGLMLGLLFPYLLVKYVLSS